MKVVPKMTQPPSEFINMDNYMDYKKRYSGRLESLNACIVEAVLLEDDAAISWLRAELTKIFDRINKLNGLGD